MDVFDKFFERYSYKFPKGYPDFTNKQDILILENILNEIGLFEVTDEDSKDLPDVIIQLKSDIQAISGLDNVTTVKKAGGRNYSFYIKGVGDRDRKERREVGKKIIQGLPKNYIIGDNNFNDETELLISEFDDMNSHTDFSPTQTKNRQFVEAKLISYTPASLKNMPVQSNDTIFASDAGADAGEQFFSLHAFSINR